MWTITRKHGRGQPIANPDQRIILSWEPRPHLVHLAPASHPLPDMSLLCKREHGRHVHGQLMSRYAENHLASILISCFYRKCSAESSEPPLQHRASAIFMTSRRSRAPCLFLHLGRGADAEVTVKEKHSNNWLTIKGCIWTWLPVPGHQESWIKLFGHVWT